MNTTIPTEEPPNDYPDAIAVRHHHRSLGQMTAFLVTPATMIEYVPEHVRAELAARVCTSLEPMVASVLDRLHAERDDIAQAAEKVRGIFLSQLQSIPPRETSDADDRATPTLN